MHSQGDRHERFHLTYGQFTICGLSEVPRDPVDGKPLRYRLNSDGTFLLYSIGQDYKDDGGDPTSTAPIATFYWLRGRDWVWPQPATPQEIQYYYGHPPK